jgi:D-amino-acid dehydrogenase
MSARYQHLVQVPAGAHCSDPGAYVSALVHQAEREGVVHVQGQALGWERHGSQIVGLQVAGHGCVKADRVVIAAGIGSAALARALGDAVPLASERGYHIVLPLRPGDPPPLAPVMPSDGKMAITLTAQGLRLAGQVELATTDAAPDWRRADVLWRHAARMLSDEAWAATTVAAHRHARTVPPGVARWMGHRPSMADGLPSIGPSRRHPEVIHAFGHGHVGLAAAPITAQWVREWIVAGEAPHAAAQACRPR